MFSPPYGRGFQIRPIDLQSNPGGAITESVHPPTISMTRTSGVNKKSDYPPHPFLSDRDVHWEAMGFDFCGI